MLLSEKLSSISRKNVVSEFDTLLNGAKVSIDWYGRRLVAVDGYEGFVEINHLAHQYLDAEPFYITSKPTLKERFECYVLWDRVKKLYSDSHKELKKNCLYNWIITPLQESIDFGSPAPVIEEQDLDDTKDFLLAFPPAEFNRIWPWRKAERQLNMIDGETDHFLWVATIEMVEAAYKKKAV